MNKFIRIFSCLALVSLLAAGCSVNRTTAVVDPSADLSTVKKMYVVKLDDDQSGVNTLIANKLRALGYAVAVEPESRAGVDALVTYRDEWVHDITAYMLELDIVIRDVRSGFPLASGSSYHTSLSRRAPNEMVDEVIDNIFKKGQGK